MNKNIFKLFEISLAIFVFITAISITLNIHDHLNSAMVELEGAGLDSNLEFQSKSQGIYVQEKDHTLFDERSVYGLICSDVIMENFSKSSDNTFSSKNRVLKRIPIRLDFMNCYVHELDTIPDIPSGRYEIRSISDSNYEIIEIQVIQR